MKRLGPELKMPKLNRSNLKMPPFLVDLYWDLRDRRLLPLVALAIVAIVAAPFLLAGGSKESSSVALAEVAAVPGGSVGSEASSLTVIEAKPGLREYSKRLDHRRPTDPFEQRYTTPPPVHGKELGPETTSPTSGSSTSTSTSASVSSETTTTSTVVESSPSEPPSHSGGASSGEPELRLFAFAVDVKITRIEDGEDGAKPKTESNTKHKVMPTTPLPGEKAPVVTYMGVGQGAKNALLMVSPNVQSIFGDAKCLSGTDTCQLLEVEPGLPETFVYGENGVRYKVNVLKIEPVATGHS
jgi:hypothetical protein